MRLLSALFFTCLFLISTIGKINANTCGTANPVTPVVLASTGLNSGTLLNETWSGTAQCTGPGSRPDVWYSFTAISSTMFVQATGSGDINIAIEAFSSCGGASIGCRNVSGAGGTELLRLTGLSVGNTYYFSVFHVGAAPNVSNNFTVVVGYIPFVELRAQECDQFDYTTNSIIRSTSPPASSFTVTGYQWKFEELEPPFNTYEVVSPNGTNPNYRLLWLNPLQYGRSYDVSVRLLVAEGNSVGDYGSVCTIGLQPTVLTTQLEQQYANQFFSFCSIIGADAVGLATQYRWVLNDFEDPPLTAFGDGNSRQLRLQKVPNLKLGRAYIVSVFATVNGDESPQGTLRFIIMNNTVPPTGLRQDLYPCGQTYAINSFVQAVEVCSATSYSWRFTNTSQSQPTILYTRTDGSRFLRLDWLTDLIPGDNYNVEVRATQGGLTGAYSAVCNITIGASTAGMMAQNMEDKVHTDLTIGSEEMQAQFNMTLSGNAQDASVLNIQVANEREGMVSFEMYDVSGKLVAKRQEAVYGTADVRWNTNQLPRGIYILRAFNGTEVATQKVVI